jgi:hypothetical protein
MSLTELTSRTAVLAALREFDERGRELFLTRYGFDHARSYFLEYEGSRYDSKAIAGVAHGIQHPHLGPLRAADFSGGEATVKKVLEGLGFRVLCVTARDSSMWALCANPSRYRIREAVKHLGVDYWLVGRADVREGDAVAVWQTRDAEGHRGVVALGQIVGEPETRRDSENPFWVSVDDAQSEGIRVPVRYQRLSTPLWVDETEVGQFLASLSVARAQGGTVFHLTNEQWAQLVGLVGGFVSEEPSIAELEAAIRTPNRFSSGQGFGLSASERAVLESYAMHRAKEYFAIRWSFVIDVSRTCSFDLLCRSANAELRVEVKGTTSLGERVVLTKREIEEATMPGYVLFVVSEVVLAWQAGSVVARGGRCRIIPQWRSDKHTLKPIAYDVTLDWSEGEAIEPGPAMASSGQAT